MARLQLILVQVVVVLSLALLAVSFRLSHKYAEYKVEKPILIRDSGPGLAFDGDVFYSDSEPDWDSQDGPSWTEGAFADSDSDVITIRS